LLVRNPSYRCTRCGFGARSHHWQCPSCKEWGTVKPLRMPWSEAALAAPAALVVATLVASKSPRWQRLAISHAHRNGLLDHPGGAPQPPGADTPRRRYRNRRASLLALLVIAATAALPFAWLLVAGGLSLVSLVGWWDDHRPPSPPWLGVRACIGCRLPAGRSTARRQPAGGRRGLRDGHRAGECLNFMDGTDGSATSQPLLCALGLAVVLGDAWRLLALVAGACLGSCPSTSPGESVPRRRSGALGYLVAALLAAGFALHPHVVWPLRCRRWRCWSIPA
jgi:hypothetical protein